MNNIWVYKGNKSNRAHWYTHVLQTTRKTIGFTPFYIDRFVRIIGQVHLNKHECLYTFLIDFGEHGFPGNVYVLIIII